MHQEDYATIDRDILNDDNVAIANQVSKVALLQENHPTTEDEDSRTTYYARSSLLQSIPQHFRIVHVLLGCWGSLQPYFAYMAQLNLYNTTILCEKLY